MKTKATLKLDAYKILSEKVESGIAYGLRRCWKYCDEPAPDEPRLLQMTETICEAVMNEIAEVLKDD